MINQLNQREKIFLFVGGSALTLTILYFAILEPYSRALNRLDRQLAVGSAQVLEVKALESRYLALQREMTQIEGTLVKGQAFSALTFIESLVESTAGRENLISMRPQSPETRNEYTVDAVEIKLEKLSLKQVLDLLAGIETAKSPMQIKNLSLKQRFDDQSLLNASMTVTALRRAK